MYDFLEIGAMLTRNRLQGSTSGSTQGSSSTVPPPTTISPNNLRFASSFVNAEKFFYFHHIVDAENALLTVEVIGPNLLFTFSHHRAKGLRRTSSIGTRLENKTAGFLALIKNDVRHVLAQAESGHGGGPLGDLLDAPLDSPILPNDVWSRRTVRIGNLIGCSMDSPYDTGRRDGNMVVTSIVTGDQTTLREEMRGLYAGSHVEVKLAVYAVCTMLKEFGITTDFDNLTITQLRKLRRVKWDDGQRPSFEVYFSRKNCPRCGRLVEALEKVTGLKIALCWKERLIKKEYSTRKRQVAAREGIIADHRAAAPGEIIDIDDDDDDELGVASTVGMTDTNTVDLTSERDELPNSPIDLTQGADHILHNPLYFPGTLPEQGGGDDDRLADPDYVPEELLQQPAERQTPQPEDQLPVDDRRIPKPLPATAVINSPKEILNAATRTVFNRLQEWNPFANRGTSLDPQALRNQQSNIADQRPKKGDSNIIRDGVRARKRGHISPGSAVRAWKRRRYSVAPIVTHADEDDSSSEDSIPNVRTYQAVHKTAVQPRAGVRRGANQTESVSNDNIPSIAHRARSAAPYLLKLGNTRSFEHVRADDRAINTEGVFTQQITPPKTPYKAGMGYAVGEEPESPTPQMRGRQASLSPDPF